MQVESELYITPNTAKGNQVRLQGKPVKYANCPLSQSRVGCQLRRISCGTGWGGEKAPRLLITLFRICYRLSICQEYMCPSIDNALDALAAILSKTSNIFLLLLLDKIIDSYLHSIAHYF